MALHLSLMAAPMVLQMKKHGISEAGARQALSGQVISNPQDRAQLAALLMDKMNPGKNFSLQQNGPKALLKRP